MNQIDHGQREIVQFTSNGAFVKVWPSIHDAIKVTHITGIPYALKNQKSKGGGYFWRYSDAFEGAIPESILVSFEKRNRDKQKAVAKYSLDGKLIRVYSSMTEAATDIQTSRENVKSCCGGRLFQLKGFIFRKVEDFGTIAPDAIDVSFLEQRHKSKRIPVLQYSTDGVLIAQWDSASHAAEAVGGKPDAIRDNCNGRSRSAYGFLWKYDAQQEQSSQETGR